MGLERLPGLQPLSRQHRDLLMLALNLRLSARGLGSDPETATRELLTLWARIGEGHFRYEENQLLASYGQVCDVQSDSAVKTMLAQHAQIRQLIEQLAAPNPAQENRRRLVGEIGELLNEHIRHEERIVFPQMQERMSEADLNSLPALPTSAEGQGQPSPTQETG